MSDAPIETPMFSVLSLSPRGSPIPIPSNPRLSFTLTKRSPVSLLSSLDAPPIPSRMTSVMAYFTVWRKRGRKPDKRFFYGGTVTHFRSVALQFHYNAGFPRTPRQRIITASPARMDDPIRITLLKYSRHMMVKFNN